MTGTSETHEESEQEAEPTLARRVGQHLRRLRAATGKTQGELATKIGVSPATVSNWEAGRHLEALTKVDSAFRALGTSFLDEALARGGGSPSSDPLLDAINELGSDDDVFFLLDIDRIVGDEGLWAYRLRRLATSSSRVRVTLIMRLPSVHNGRVGDELLRESLRIAREDHGVDVKALGLDLRWMYYDPRLTEIGPSTGMYCFLFAAHGLRTVYQEVEVDKAAPPGHPKNEWIRVRDSLKSALWENLRAGLLPVVDPVWQSNRLQSPVQSSCRDHRCPDRLYVVLRKLASKPSYREKIALIQRLLEQGQPIPAPRILDIGPGDFEPSVELVYDELRKVGGSGTRIQITGLVGSKSADIPGIGETLWREPTVAVFPETTALEHFRGKEFFGLCVAIHSLYVVDVAQITRIMAHLRPPDWSGRAEAGGKLLIVHAAYRGNFFSELCGAVDRWLLERLQLRELDLRVAYPDKVVSEDPLRSFSEDIEDWLRKARLRPEQLQGRVPEVRTQVPVSLIWDDGDWTPKALDIVRYFICGLQNEIGVSRQDDVAALWAGSAEAAKLASDLRDRLAQDRQATVENVERLLVIERPRIENRMVLRQASGGGRASPDRVRS
jgi:transcriptional regulator with XRE-family HTH domain